MELKGRKDPGRTGMGAALLVAGIAGLIVLAFGGDPYAWNIENDLVGILIVPGIALALIAAGVLGRNVGLLIGGSVTAGVGAGVVLLAGFDLNLGGTANGGAFLLALAAGFLLVIPLVALVAGQRHWWPLLPAAGLAALGLVLLAGETERLTVLGDRYLWAFVLLALGLLLLRPAKR